TGSYTQSLTVFTALFAVALAISLLIRLDIKRLRKQQSEGAELAS
ncbi:MFS transporter, partial [Bacillus sp. JJ1521]